MDHPGECRSIRGGSSFPDARGGGETDQLAPWSAGDDAEVRSYWSSRGGFCACLKMSNEKGRRSRELQPKETRSERRLLRVGPLAISKAGFLGLFNLRCTQLWVKVSHRDRRAVQNREDRSIVTSEKVGLC